MSADIQLAVPEEFHAFPYNPPYSIQTNLMRHLYSAIECRKLTVVESPTGTGKTLSLLTSSLTWLRDDKHRIKRANLESLRNSLHSVDDPEWVVTQTFDRLKKEIEAEDRDFEEHLTDLRTKEQALKRECARVTKRPKLSNPGETESVESGDDSFLPGCYEGSNRREGHENAMSPLNNDESTGVADVITYDSFTGWVYESSRVYLHFKFVDPNGPKQIFYASRTHSQLSQVVQELMKLKSISASSGDAKSDRDRPSNLNNPSLYLPRSVSLASRAHLCINERLRAKTSDLDEGCRALLTGRPEERCPFLPRPGEEYRLHELRDRILASPKDIEDLVHTGKEMKLCPYFSSRSAISSAELVTLPYNLLLHKRSRQALDIDLKDQVIIIDEAHNLIETLLELHTIELSTSMLRLAIKQLTEYMSRFRTRLTTAHAIHLKRLTLFLRALDLFVDSRFTETCRSPTYEDVMSVTTFVDNIGNKVNGINFLELQSYLTASKIFRKVSGYAEKRTVNNNVGVEKGDTSAIAPLHAVEAFVATLTNGIEDGIITFTTDKLIPGERHIKYQHLNPATHFDELIRSARCVILAGGTMSPISDMSLQLFPYVPNDQLCVFSCGHVIPQSNLQCLVIGKGPRGREFQFKFKNRGDQSLIDDLGQCLFNIVSVSPNGMVVFFPSYSFLDEVKGAWSSNGLLGRIQKKKQIFYEPHESVDVEDVLREYSLACTQTVGTVRGALLLAVVGAKLSEGLNFADELARAVVLVGIPYPNLASPELRERMKYINKRTRKEYDTEKDAGNELYENLAMRAVNQSIGRAIRHRSDWSTLILIDSRYASQKVQLKLPAWIRQNITVPHSFGQAVKLLSDFYRAKRP